MKDKLLKIVEFMQKNIKADDYTLVVNSKERQDTRFAQNSITQHMSGSSTYL
jgi:hypothetical protein